MLLGHFVFMSHYQYVIVFYLIFSIALMLKEHYPRLNTNCLNETTLWCIFGLRCEVLSAFLRRNWFCPRVQAHSCIHVCTPLTKRNSISSMCSLLLLYALCCCCNVILQMIDHLFVVKDVETSAVANLAGEFGTNAHTLKLCLTF